MGFKVRVSFEYEYGGDNDTAEAIRQEEYDSFAGGDCSIEDVLAADPNAKLEVIVTETVDADDD